MACDECCQEGEAREREKDVEVEDAVEDVEGEGLCAVEVGALAVGGKDVVEEDVEGGEDGAAEEEAVEGGEGQGDGEGAGECPGGEVGEFGGWEGGAAGREAAHVQREWDACH